VFPPEGRTGALDRAFAEAASGYTQAGAKRTKKIKPLMLPRTCQRASSPSGRASRAALLNIILGSMNQSGFLREFQV